MPRPPMPGPRKSATRLDAGPSCAITRNLWRMRLPPPNSTKRRVESACWMLLRRYGVVFRDLLQHEQTIPRWRELLGLFRRLEARGEIRGGRFLSGFGGEQFALPEAVESLRSLSRELDRGPISPQV